VTAWGTLGELAKLGLPLPPFLHSLRFPFHTFLLVTCSNLASFALGYLTTVLMPTRWSGSGPGLTVWDLRTGGTDEIPMTTAGRGHGL
jgi:hypothetical protein